MNHKLFLFTWAMPFSIAYTLSISTCISHTDTHTQTHSHSIVSQCNEEKTKKKKVSVSGAIN